MEIMNTEKSKVFSTIPQLEAYTQKGIRFGWEGSTRAAVAKQTSQWQPLRAAYGTGPNG